MFTGLMLLSLVVVLWLVGGQVEECANQLARIAKAIEYHGKKGGE